MCIYIDPIAELELVWEALHTYRDECIPEGKEAAYDAEWSDICTAMARLRETFDA